MSTLRLFVVACTCLLAARGADRYLTAAPTDAPEVTAFVNVNVVPMDTDRVLHAADIRHATRVSAPPNALRIDG